MNLPPNDAEREAAERTCPAHFAVIFTSQRAPGDDEAYAAMAARMEELARAQPGFLGIESARNDRGAGITVSFWRDRASIRAWREQLEHRRAQALGKSQWYASYTLRICGVEEEYSFARDVS